MTVEPTRPRAREQELEARLAAQARELDELTAQHHELRARLQREQRARVARRELSTLATEATSATTAAEVATALANGSVDVVGGQLSLVALPNDEQVDLVHGSSVPPATRADWTSAPFDAPVPVVAALADGAGWIEVMDAEAMRDWPLLARETQRTGTEALVAIPLRPEGYSRTLGALAVGFASPGPLGDFERALLTELCEVGTSALARVEELRLARSSIETLQRSLLPPRLPEVTDLDVVAYYEPGAARARVGGDWYDQLVLEDGSVAFVIGDVAGHDLRAAATMGQVRHVLASQLVHTGDPAEALTRTDRYFAMVDESVLATAFVVVLDPDRRRLRYATAGHLSPLLCHCSTGRATPLAVTPGAPLGTGFGIPPTQAAAFTADDLLVLFTDGLVERRGVPLDVGIAELATEVATVVEATDPHAASRTVPVATAITAALQHSPHDDDVALLVVAVSPP